MKRREFVKGLFGTLAIAAVPLPTTPQPLAQGPDIEVCDVAAQEPVETPKRQTIDVFYFEQPTSHIIPSRVIAANTPISITGNDGPDIEYYGTTQFDHPIQQLHISPYPLQGIVRVCYVDGGLPNPLLAAGA